MDPAPAIPRAAQFAKIIVRPGKRKGRQLPGRPPALASRGIAGIAGDYAQRDLPLMPAAPP
jgi:hypothetical protein